jgi:DnaJ-class molecular chaperone
MKTVEGLGMPFHKQSYKCGNLFILFHVDFPDKLGPKQLSGIEEALSFVKPAKLTETGEVKVKLVKFEDAHKNTHHEGGTEGNGEDEEEEGSGAAGQRVQCASQ